MNEPHLSLHSLELGAGQTRSFGMEGLLFLMPQGGEATCVCGSQRTPMSKGYFLVVSNSGSNPVVVEEARDFRAGWFSVRLDQMFPLFGTSEIAFLGRVAEAFLKPRRYPVSGGVAKECSDWVLERRSFSCLEHRSRLLCVVAEVLAQDFQRVRQERCSGSLAEQGFLNTFERLTVDELQNLDIEALAVKFHCGRRHLNRQFQRYLGVSVAELRKEARLMKAFCLLRDPVIKIMSVAEQCGFNHLGLFNATFRARFGASPSQVRKGLIGAEGHGGVDDRFPAYPDGLVRDEVGGEDGAGSRPGNGSPVHGAGKSPQTRKGRGAPSGAGARSNTVEVPLSKAAAGRTRDWIHQKATELMRANASKKGSTGLVR